MKKCLIILCFTLLTFWTKEALTQNRVDSIVMNYLSTKNDIDKPTYQIVKKGKKETISTNFFVEPNDPIRFGDIIIRTYLFGPNVSHNRKYFLLTLLQAGNRPMEKIIDSTRLKDALAELFIAIEPYSLPETKKAILVNQLSLTYY